MAMLRCPGFRSQVCRHVVAAVWVALLAGLSAACRPSAPATVSPDPQTPSSTAAAEAKRREKTESSNVSESTPNLEAKSHKLVLTKSGIAISVKMLGKPEVTQNARGVWMLSGMLSRLHPKVLCYIEQEHPILPAALENVVDVENDSTRRGFDVKPYSGTTMWSVTESPPGSGKETQVVVSNTGDDLFSCRSDEGGEFNEFLEFVQGLAWRMKHARDKLEDEGVDERLVYVPKTLESAEGKRYIVENYVRTLLDGTTYDIRSIHEVHQLEGKSAHFTTQTCTMIHSDQEYYTVTALLSHERGEFAGQDTYTMREDGVFLNKKASLDAPSETSELTLKDLVYTRIQRRNCMRFLLQQPDAKQCRFTMFVVRDGSIEPEAMTMRVVDRNKRMVRARGTGRDLMLWINQDFEVTGVAEYSKTAKGPNPEQLLAWTLEPCGG